MCADIVKKMLLTNYFWLQIVALLKHIREIRDNSDEKKPQKS